VRGDAETVAQVLRHVVQNALEAVGTTGRVDLALSREPDFGRVRVADDGPGMTAEFIRDKLFRPFSTTKASGYGIGAYQARELIRRMGGRLEVASTLGEGTEVSIRLPIAEAKGTAARQVQEA
jgi:signal transduction histidine kinase